MEQYHNLILQYGIYIIATLILLRLIFRRRVRHYHSNWNTLLENQNFSALEFFQDLKSSFTESKVTRINYGNKKLRQHSLGFTKRQYLTITYRDEYEALVCASPYGNHFFISYHIRYKVSWGEILLRLVPFGNLIANRLYKVTYYKYDTACAFLGLLDQEVKQEIDNRLQSQGTKASFEKPVINDFFKR